MARRLVGHQRTMPFSQSVIAVAKTWFSTLLACLSFVSVYRHRRSSGSVIQTEGAAFTHRNHPPCVHLPIDNYCVLLSKQISCRHEPQILLTCPLPLTSTINTAQNAIKDLLFAMCKTVREVFFVAQTIIRSI